MGSEPENKTITKISKQKIRVSSHPKRTEKNDDFNHQLFNVSFRKKYVWYFAASRASGHGINCSLALAVNSWILAKL